VDATKRFLTLKEKHNLFRK